MTVCKKDTGEPERRTGALEAAADELESRTEEVEADRTTLESRTDAAIRKAATNEERIEELQDRELERRGWEVGATAPRKK